jgi:hypothetical protein
MSRLLGKLWSDDRGALLATEFVFMASLLAMGTVAGLTAVRQAVVSELTETGKAILSLDQSFSFSGQSNAVSSTGGSAAVDHTSTIRAGATAPTAAAIHQVPCD